MKWLREQFEATKDTVHVYIRAMHLFYPILISYTTGPFKLK
jgi:hypothetical protein